MKAIRYSIFAVCMFLFGACGGTDEPETEPQPALRLTVKDTGSNTVTLELKTINSAGVSALVLDSDSPAPDAATLMASGTRTSESTIVFDGLRDSGIYTAYAVSFSKSGKKTSSVQSISFTLAEGVPFLYDWEASRSGLLSYDNLVLCYGGSAHRTAGGWPRERFDTHVAYKDANGTERWLFDAFLAIEFAMTQNNMDLMIGAGGVDGAGNANRQAANKACWEAVMDFWFKRDNGFDALDKSVGAAISRIGKPSRTRKVIMVLPDAAPYSDYNNDKSVTNYWGSLDGRRLDFAKAEDRLSALKWYINEVRARWDKAGYRNLEFAGFYIVSESLQFPGVGWKPEMKRWEEILPEISKYIHSANESLTWIPYYASHGYTYWQDMQLDYVQMQPNHFWANHPTYSLSEFGSMVKANGLSMELEMDDAMLNSQPGADAYRGRFREYMQTSRDLGLYGTREHSYYCGENTIYKLANSKDEQDRKIFLELCSFVAGNRRSE